MIQIFKAHFDIIQTIISITNSFIVKLTASLSVFSMGHSWVKLIIINCKLNINYKFVIPSRSAGVVQGMVTGMRGLCNGLGPAMFGVIFYLFHVDLNDEHSKVRTIESGEMVDSKYIRNETLAAAHDIYGQFMPGPPFVFGALMVVVAILVAAFIPTQEGDAEAMRRASGRRKSSDLFLFRLEEAFGIVTRLEFY